MVTDLELIEVVGRPAISTSYCIIALLLTQTPMPRPEPIEIPALTCGEVELEQYEVAQGDLLWRRGCLAMEAIVS